MRLFDGRCALLADLYDRLPLLMDFDEAETYEGFEPMPLSITSDPAGAVIHVDMMTLSVCGGAPHADLAMSDAETLASSIGPMERILFAGGADDTPELMEELEQYRLEQADNERMRDLFSSESIHAYAALASYLRPMAPIGYEYFSAQQNTRYLLSAFVGGEMAAEPFIREFEQVQPMMMLEDE